MARHGRQSQAIQTIGGTPLASDVQKRIDTLAQWMFESHHLVVFTGAGISTASGLPDFRGPNGIWTRQEKGLPTPSLSFSSAEPNASHMAIVELQGLGKLDFLISQNVDNLHLKSGIRPELLAELHGNVTKLRCRDCGFKCDSFPDLETCPECGGKMASSVVNFGAPLPVKHLEDSESSSKNCDLFIVIGSSLVVYPAADMPRIALDSGSRLVIINKQETPFDKAAHLRFWEEIDDVFPVAVRELKDLM